MCDSELVVGDVGKAHPLHGAGYNFYPRVERPGYNIWGVGKQIVFTVGQ